jgi:TRAP-type C4-dicarboxylate transport system permease small subunit
MLTEDTPNAPIDKNWADRLSDGIAVVLNFVIASMLFVMCAVTVWQVFSRYVLNDASSWSEEVARIMMTYMALIGSAVVIKTGGHVTVTVLLDRVSPGILKWLLIFRDLFMLFTLIIVGWSGFGFAQMNAVQLSAAMDLPMIYVYAALWLGSGLMILMLVLARFSRTNVNWTAQADGFE